MQSMKNRVVRIPDETWVAAKVAAEKEGTTVSAVIRRLLSAYVRSGAVVLVVLACTTGSVSASTPDPADVELCQAHLQFNAAEGDGSERAAVQRYSAAFHALTNPDLIAAESNGDGSQDVRALCLTYGVDIRP